AKSQGLGMTPTPARRTRPKDSGPDNKVSGKSLASRTLVHSIPMDIANSEVESVRKRRREEYEERDASALRRMRAVTEHLRDYLFNPANMIGRQMANEVLSRTAEMEDVLLEILLENERLIGMMHADNSNNLHTNEGPHKNEQNKVNYASVAAMTCNKKLDSAKKRHAIVVRPKTTTMTSEQVKRVVLDKIQPKINDGIKVNALRTIRNGGITIETVNEKDLNKIKNSKLFEQAGLVVDIPRKILPKIIIYDVPEEINNDELMDDIHSKNLSEIISMKELKDRARIITRGGKKDSNITNVIIGLPGKAWKRLVEAGRIYVGWNSFKTRDFELVQRCYGCYGFGHRLRECNAKGRVCRKCGRIGHTQLECDNDRKTRLKIAQINLQRSRAATNNLLGLTESRKVDICFVQEPHAREGQVVGLGTKARTYHVNVGKPKSAICAFGTRVSTIMLSHLTTELITVVEISTPEDRIYGVSAYLPPVKNQDFDFIAELETLKDTIRELRQKGEVILGMDANSKSPVWGSPTEDNRGISLAEALEDMEMTVINQGDTPTFDGPRGTSFIDITAVTAALYPRIQDWDIPEEESASDHRYIEWTVAPSADGTAPAPQETRGFCNARADWDKFTETYRRQTESLIQRIERIRTAAEVEDCAKLLNTAVQEACAASMPRRRKFVGSTRLLETRIEKWKEFCSEASERDPWGPACRAIRRSRPPAKLSCIRREDGSHTMTQENTAEELLARFFPRDNPANDTEEQERIRATADTAVGTRNDRNITANEIRRVAERMSKKKAPGHDGITADACVTYENERREAQDQLQRVGDTWPTTLEEVTALAGSRMWWMALTRFAKQTAKFKIDRV
ncbi:hypothetical protein CBL_20258, partial [Carabus blaptoides fortunei]